MAKKVPFDPKVFLATANGGRTLSKYLTDNVIFSQGDPADAVFYIQKGRVKITVVSEQGKEAVVAVLGPDEFCGEGCLAGQPRRMARAEAMTECEIMRLEKSALMRVLHEEPALRARQAARPRDRRSVPESRFRHSPERLEVPDSSNMRVQS